MPKNLPLTQGKFAIVDDDLFEYLSQWSWCYGSGYPRRTVRRDDGTETVQYLHHAVLPPVEGRVTDHIDGDKLNAQKANLRYVTTIQNLYNAGIHLDKKGKYKGVRWRKDIKKWQVQVYNKSHKEFGGHFSDEKEAAKVYNEIAKRLYGEYARLNEV